MTCQDWVLRFSSPSGTHRATYAWTDSAVNLSGIGVITPTLANVADIAYEVTPEQDSIEASWTGGSAEGRLSIQSADLIVIYRLGSRAGESSSTYYPRFRGIVTVPTNPVDDTMMPQAYRAVGAREWLYSADTGENTETDAGIDLALGFAADCRPTGTLYYGITWPVFDAIGVVTTGAVNPTV